jgi:cell division topological specificity factor
MEFLRRLFGSSSSAETAKQRLRFVLIHDRAEIPPGMLELIKDDIIAVISRRINIDRDNVEVNVNNSGPESKLLVDIPILPDNVRETGRQRGTPQRPQNQQRRSAK